MQRSIAVIWNENAGTAAGNSILRDELAARGDVEILFPHSSDEARQMAAEAAGSGADVVAAAGGDGTINDVAQGLLDAGGSAALGAIPLGTGNDFCRNAGISLDPLQAAALLGGGPFRPIDVIRVETEGETSHYINMATGGNTGLYTGLITDEMKRFWGPLVYVRGTVDVLANLQVYRATIGFDDEPPFEVDALNVFVANGRGTGGGLPVAPDAELNDGLLDAIVIKDCAALDIASLATDYALSDYRENENIISRRAASVSVAAVPPLVFSTDGDVLGDVREGETIRFSVQPNALRLVVGSTG